MLVDGLRSHSGGRYLTVGVVDDQAPEGMDARWLGPLDRLGEIIDAVHAKWSSTAMLREDTVGPEIGAVWAPTLPMTRPSSPASSEPISGSRGIRTSSVRSPRRTPSPPDSITPRSGRSMRICSGSAASSITTAATISRSRPPSPPFTRTPPPRRKPRLSWRMAVVLAFWYRSSSWTRRSISAATRRLTDVDR